MALVNLNLIPSFVGSIVKLTHEDGNEDVSIHNSRVKTMVHVAIAALAYVGTVHIASRFGYQVPTLALVAGALAFPESARWVAAAHFFAKGAKDGWVQGRAGNVAEAVKAVAMAAFAYASTTPMFSKFLNTYVYPLAPGYISQA